MAPVRRREVIGASTARRGIPRNTSGAAGKNMSPATIEMAVLTAGRAISQVCVIGDRRPYDVCLVVPNRAEFDPDDTEAAVSAAVRAQVDAANAGLARVEIRYHGDGAAGA